MTSMEVATVLNVRINQSSFTSNTQPQFVPKLCRCGSIVKKGKHIGTRNTTLKTLSRTEKGFVSNEKSHPLAWLTWS